MSIRSQLLLLPLAGAAFLLPRPPAAGAPPDQPASAERTLDVVASEFAFAAPDTLPAGRTRVRLLNRGGELHVLEVARLDDGHTAEELAAHLAARRPPPAWATFVAGPIAPVGAGLRPGVGPPEGLAVTVELAPGRYALLCPVPSPNDHQSHMAKGMVRTLVVTPAPQAAPATPRRAEPARVVLDDFGFVLEPAWRAGRRVVRVENRAAQPHEVVVFRLDPGKHVADVVRWAGSLVGPPPGTFVAGTTAIGRGQVARLTLALDPGAYALLCFLPDATDGRSHIRHGMTRELTVR